MDQLRIEKLSPSDDQLVVSARAQDEISNAKIVLQTLFRIKNLEDGGRVGNLEVVCFGPYQGVLFLLRSHGVDYYDFPVGILSENGLRDFSVYKIEQATEEPKRTDRFHGVHDVMLYILCVRINEQVTAFLQSKK